MQNRSPWLHQLDQGRQTQPLGRALEPGVAIVGAGIAGIATAFFTLKYTDKTVAILERHKLAHGATGHNGGQIVSYFERGFASLCEEFGIPMAAKGQQAVEDAWELLDEMYTDAGLDIPFARFVGHAGLSSFAQILFHLRNNEARRRAGLNLEEMIIAEDALFLHEIPREFVGLYRLAPCAEILERLETKNPQYIACLSYQKGCINSALFCQEVAAYLTREYPGRFALYEHTPVHKILLRDSHGVIDAGEYVVKAPRIVLCTNGFKDFTLISENGLGLDGTFHAALHGRVAYMSGYLERLNKAPIAVSYFPEPGATAEENYFYLTRRPYEYEHKSGHNLISLGGPDEPLPEDSAYSLEAEFPEKHMAVFDKFLRSTYDLDPNKKIDYLFTWHGLMGYTKNGVRMAGPEPKNPVLLYNLGCNGIGILPSTMGGRKIARHLEGEKVEKSIFDVPKR
jgi:glycine/D-amino acid oxidase-like deaminating enzyme